MPIYAIWHILVSLTAVITSLVFPSWALTKNAIQNVSRKANFYIWSVSSEGSGLSNEEKSSPSKDAAIWQE